MQSLTSILDALPVRQQRAARDALSHACIRGSLRPDRPRVLMLTEADPPVVAPGWVGELVQMLGAEPLLQQFAGLEITPAMIGEHAPDRVLLVRQASPDYLIPMTRDLLHELWRGA